MDNNIRDILPTMAHLFNNSVLTNKVANALAEKLDQAEFRDLKEYLKHAKSNLDTQKRKAKRPW